MPVDKPMLAVPLMNQLPPVVASLSVVLRPEQTANVPVIGPGSGFTVTTAVIRKVGGKVYVMTAVPNAPTPVTTPEVLILAMPGAPLAQVPPVLRSERAVVNPEH